MPWEFFREWAGTIGKIECEAWIEADFLGVTESHSEAKEATLENKTAGTAIRGLGESIG